MSPLLRDGGGRLSYIYHLKPEPMLGNSLIPLNQMDRDSDLYKEHVKKYEGRETLMKKTLPKLNCLWNDVVQFSAIDPQILLNELVKLQPNMKLKRFEYYKIHKNEILKNYNAVIYTADNSRVKGDRSPINENEVVIFDGSYAELTEIPKKTKEVWSESILSPGALLWFPFVPHIFINEQVSIEEAQVCRLSLK